MFDYSDKILANLVTVYYSGRAKNTNAVFANINNAVCHTATMNVSGRTATLTVDGIAETESKFEFTKSLSGCFSLATNSNRTNLGAFTFLRLSVGDKPICHINFEELSNIEVLDKFFDCYYFPTLDRSCIPSKVRIRDYWMLNCRRHLQCVRPDTDRWDENDTGPLCLLTLRHPPIGDFQLEFGFEQCWRRYGVIFGCNPATLPFYYDRELNAFRGTAGGYAFIESDGVRAVYGNQLHTLQKDPIKKRYLELLPKTFITTSGNLTCAPHRHSIAFHTDSDTVYVHGETILPAKTGCIVYMPPDYEFVPYGHINRYIMIEFDCLNPISFSPASFQPMVTDRFLQHFEKILSSWHNHQLGNQHLCLSIFHKILYEIQSEMGSAQFYTSPHVKHAVSYINTHYSEPDLTIAKIAEALNISEISIYKQFQKNLNITPHQYIKKLRIEHAVALLNTHFYKIYEIAEKCGFSDSKYFITAFKSVMGMSPQNYINSMDGHKE